MSQDRPPPTWAKSASNPTPPGIEPTGLTRPLKRGHTPRHVKKPKISSKNRKSSKNWVPVVQNHNFFGSELLRTPLYRSQNTPLMCFWSNDALSLVLWGWYCNAVPWCCNAAPSQGRQNAALLAGCTGWFGHKWQ